MANGISRNALSYAVAYFLGILVCHMLRPVTPQQKHDARTAAPIAPITGKEIIEIEDEDCPTKQETVVVKKKVKSTTTGKAKVKSAKREAKPWTEVMPQLFQQQFQELDDSRGKNASRDWPICRCLEDFEAPVEKLDDAGIEEYRKQVRDSAQTCKRESGATAGNTIGLCAGAYLSTELPRRLGNDSRIVFDYGWDGHAHPVVPMLPEEWVFLTAYLPMANKPAEKFVRIPANQLAMAPPTPYRLRSLFVTNSIFDVNIVLRLDELLAFTKMEFLPLLGRILAMARTTFLLLPCDLKHYNDDLRHMRAQDLVMEAARAVMSESRGQLGVHFFDFEVEVLASFKDDQQEGGCAQELLLITAVKIHRGVRLKWCYYPLGTKYDLIYRRGEYMQLVHRYVQQYTTASGDKVKTIRKWKPSMNLADVIGWGLTPQQREVFFWDMLTQPSCPDAAIQNWLLTLYGRILRIDANQQAIKGNHPNETNYVEFLRIYMCMDDKEWKQVFGLDKDKRDIGLHHRTPDDSQRFIRTHLFQRAAPNLYAPINPLKDAVQKNIFPKCPDCNQCVLHTWRPLKLVWHNNQSLPPPACHKCYECQKRLSLKNGLELEAAHGCNDVEGVGEDDTSNPDFCYDTQMKPIPRPSATPAALKKGPY